MQLDGFLLSGGRGGAASANSPQACLRVNGPPQHAGQYANKETRVRSNMPLSYCIVLFVKLLFAASEHGFHSFVVVISFLLLFVSPARPPNNRQEAHPPAQ